MSTEIIINVLITSICLFALGAYFNHRERKLKDIANNQYLQIRDRLAHKIIERKAKEKIEIERLKTIVSDIEKQHKKILFEDNRELNRFSEEEMDEITRQAEEKAKLMEEDMKKNAKKFMEDQRREVQTRMVDLVMGVTKKVLSGGLTYKDHKKLIENALMEMEGEEEDD